MANNNLDRHGEIIPPGFRQGKIQKKKKLPAQKKMKARGYDPIDGLVDQYERLRKEDEFYTALRDGTLVKANPNGTLMRYSGVAHAAILAQLSRVHESLLRYNYARVPETVDLSSGDEKLTIAPFVVNLSSGKTHVISEGE
jgi:uncharacterized protein YciW